MHNLAFRAYGEVQQRTAGAKEIELSLFRQITEALESVAQLETPPLEAWADALYRNQQLWTIIATDLIGPGNTLPEETKNNLISLSQFVRQCSNRVLAGNDGMADLIDINKSIIAGLSGIPVSTVTEEAA
ncbi:MAG: flagellar biosynthesis regulator FlaF [Hyphomonas oceanitis]|uniref:flagellar biosynthesis regulator FlaF n=1 Tax=Hyphomonas oceanitis TaxID=81033 RepID=UPI0030010BB9